MIRESKTLLANIDKFFTRKYGWQYKILVVDNHFYDCYSFFLQSRHRHDKLHYSKDLLEFKRNKAKYGQVMKDLKEHYKLTIEYRDTHRLIHPGFDIVHDLSHGHGFSTSYHHNHKAK